MREVTLYHAEKLRSSSASSDDDNDDDSRDDRRSNAGDSNDDGSNRSDDDGSSRSDDGSTDDGSRTKLRLEPRCRLRLRQQRLTPHRFSLVLAYLFPPSLS